MNLITKTIRNLKKSGTVNKMVLVTPQDFRLVVLLVLSLVVDDDGASWFDNSGASSSKAAGVVVSSVGWGRSSVSSDGFEQRSVC